MAFEKWEKRTKLYKNCDKKKYCWCLNFPEATILACMRVCGCPCYHQTGALFGTQVPGKNMQIMMTTIIPCTFNMVTHTEFQIKTANVCFHFFLALSTKITMFPHFEHLKNSDQMPQKLGLILGVFLNWSLRIEYQGSSFEGLSTYFWVVQHFIPIYDNKRQHCGCRGTFA